MLKVVGNKVIETATGEILTITPKQYNVIIMIENNLGIEFTGSTTHDARQFISKNMEASKQARQRSIDNEDEEYVDHREFWGEVGTKEYDNDYYDDLADRCALDPNW